MLITKSEILIENCYKFYSLLTFEACNTLLD